MNKKILFSGFQPTGAIHIGNYLGALKNWVDLQSQYNCLYSIVDLHAMTIDYNPAAYQETILNIAMDLLAIGIDPKKSILFIQSQVPQHTELCWYFNTLTPMAELERMTQFKDKAQQHQANVNTGLFDYPVLMAADVLLYKTALVPVGQDQLQHLELANTIAKKFNHKFGKYFEEIKPVISEGARVMSLTNPEKKMSKSLGPNNLIALSDEPEIIKKKIMSAVTDTGPASGEMSKGVQNLFALLKLFNATAAHKKLTSAYNNKTLKYSDLKTELAEAVISTLKPIQDKKKQLLKNKKQVIKVLADGAKEAQKIAAKNILEIKKKMGLL
ncbi:MAG: tryptophan--tRNA ligase [bacterium]|nr:tryptophan--tRNA ligase [bacterium]